MFKSARWRSDKNKVKAVFKLQFHATQVSLLHSVFFKIIFFLGFQYQSYGPNSFDFVEVSDFLLNTGGYELNFLLLGCRENVGTENEK